MGRHSEVGGVAGFLCGGADLGRLSLVRWDGFDGFRSYAVTRIAAPRRSECFDIPSLSDLAYVQPMAPFTYVLIPAKDDEPMQEISMDEPEQLEANIGCLTKALNKYYRTHSGKQTEEGKKALVEATRQQLAKQQPNAAPDEDLMTKLAESQTCDIVQLRPATQDADWMGVNMYVDDKGVSKESPVNSRACAVCAECGCPTEVRGDAFVARLWDDQDGFKRHSITIAELSSDAPWVASARKFHADRPSADESSARLQALNMGGPQEPVTPLAERLPDAVTARAAGTEMFKTGDVDGAAERYVAAIALVDKQAGLEPEDDLAAAKEIHVACLVNLATCRLARASAVCRILRRGVSFDRESIHA